MIYELRTYKAVPGNADKMHRRFADHTLALFERHGIAVDGLWTAQDDPGTVVYIVRFASEEARKASWAAFQADEDWQRVKSESEADGPIVESMESLVLTPAAYGSGR